MSQVKNTCLAFLLIVIIPIIGVSLWITQLEGGTQFFQGLNGANQLFITLLIVFSPYSMLETSYIPIAILAGAGLLGGISAGKASHGFISGLIGCIILFGLTAFTYPLPLSEFEAFVNFLMERSNFYLDSGTFFGLLIILPTLIGGLIPSKKES